MAFKGEECWGGHGHEMDANILATNAALLAPSETLDYKQQTGQIDMGVGRQDFFKKVLFH